MIPVLLAHPKHPSWEPVEHMPLLSTRSDQGAVLGHVDVVEFLHSLFDLVLVGLAFIHSEHKCIVAFHPLHGWLDSQGELDDGIVVKLASPGGAPPRILRLPSEPQGLWPPGRWMACGSSSPPLPLLLRLLLLFLLLFLLFLLAVDAFQQYFLCLPSFCFGFSFGKSSGWEKEWLWECRYFFFQFKTYLLSNHHE